MFRATHRRELAALERLNRVAEDRAAEWKIVAEDATRLHELERRRYDDLMDKYHQLCIQGAAVPAVEGSLPVAKADPVWSAVAIKAAGNPALTRHYREFVRTERAKGTADADLEQRILTGDVIDEGVP